MVRALDEFTIRGVEHNISFLAALLQHPRFISGETLTTDMIAREYPQGFHPADAPHDAPEVIVAIAASIHRRHTDCDGPGSAVSSRGTRRSSATTGSSSSATIAIPSW